MNQKNMQSAHQIVLYLLNSLAFFWFWHEALMPSKNINLQVYLLVVSLLVVALLKRFEIGLLAFFTAISICVALFKINYFSSIFDGADVKNLIYLISFLTLFSIIILRIVFNDYLKNLNFNISQTFMISTSVLIAGQFLQAAENFSKTSALKFLVSTGEDNASWLSSLSGGFSNQTEKFNLFSASSGGGLTSALLTTTLKYFMSFDEQSSLLTDNSLVLLRIYLLCFALGIILTTLAVYNYLKTLKIYVSAPISLTAGLATYLSFSSFILYGHLTSVYSLLFLFLIFSVLTSFGNYLENFNQKIVFYSLIIFLLFAATGAWYPLRPVYYLTLIIFVIYFLVAKIDFSYAAQKKLITSFCLMGISFLVINFETVKSFVDFSLTNLIRNVHIPGGTMSPGLYHILLFSMITIFILKKGFLDDLEKDARLLLKTIIGSFFAYYVLINLVSFATPPHTVAYAGYKLGLVVTCFSLPITIALLGKKYFLFSSSNLSGFIFFGVAFIFFMYSGPPTSPSNPAWTQIGFPFGLINAINENQDTGPIWVKPMVEALDSSESKQVLCFQSNQKSIDPGQLNICSRFMNGLQGNERDPFQSVWIQVINNEITKEQFINLSPVDFESKYKVIDLSALLPAPGENEPNNLSDLFSN